MNHELTTSHSQRFNSGKPLGTGCCEWLWSIATWANGTLPMGTSHRPSVAADAWSTMSSSSMDVAVRVRN